ncbi:hypothetical protein TRICI_002173 [Trichomonascus ciferrii]|uniref:PXA domain-containing protein n=1 Tax=Trichomonascus ciferrii TaxID=44093 RepID=A0A642VBY1_9ASCO|nr:hypothetical protein TRICI_002173 [Trichomonascus ciferrii]
MGVKVFGRHVSRDALIIYGIGTVVSVYVAAQIVSKLFRHLMGVMFGFWTGVILVVGYGLVQDTQLREKNKRFKKYKFLSPDKWSDELVSLTQDKPLPTPLFPDSFVLSDTTDVLIEYIVRDFVLSWYRKFSKDTSFPAQIDNAIRSAVRQLSTRVGNVKWADVLVGKLLPILTDHFERFVTAQEIVKARSLNRPLTESKELDYAVALEYNKLSSLHPAISLQGLEYEAPRKKWLSERIDSVLPDILEKNEADYAVVFELVKNIVACSVLFPVASMLSDSDFWNQNVTKLAGSTLRDEKKVRELRQALDAHAAAVPTKRGGERKPLKLKPNADHHEFEKFLRGIRKCKSLAEVRRIRYYVSVQLKRTERNRENALYISRLQEAKDLLDKQIVALSGGTQQRQQQGAPNIYSDRDPRENYSLQEILNDPACLVYFMEFMDQKKRTLLLQFCITVNSLKDPLEDDGDEGADEDPLGGIQTEASKRKSSIKPPVEEEEQGMANKEDIIQIYLTYFTSSSKPIINFGEDIERDICQFATDPQPTFDQYMRARKALIRGQRKVYEVISERDLNKFKRSDHFLKFLASTPNNKSQPKTINSSDDFVDSLQMDAVEEDDFPEFEAVEEAFNDIMKTTNTPTNRTNNDSSSGSSVSQPRASTPSRKLFDDSEEEEREVIEDYMGPTPDEDTSATNNELHLAAPGDLGLTEAIESLTRDIEKLYSQEAVLESMLQKAELTNNTGELRILKKSHASLEREIERKELQRQQYIVQESDNSLYGRSDIKIQSYMTNSDNTGEYVLYIIEVQKFGIDGSVSAGWVVARRYSQFFDLHQHLRASFPQVQRLAFPKKRVVLKFHQQKSLVDARRAALERYLKELLIIPEVCQSKTFRLFLSSENFSAEDIDNLGAAPAAATTSNSTPQSPRSSLDLPSLTSEEPDLIGDETPIKPFVQPICDLFIQLFGLHRGNNWLRGRAVVVVLQQLLGGTIEKKIREHIDDFTTIQSVTDVFHTLLNNLWPSGQFKPSAVPRSISDRAQCKHDARLMLQKLIVGFSSRVVGSSGAKYAATHTFAMYQNEVLNSHLVYSILDAVLDELFT